MTIRPVALLCAALTFGAGNLAHAEQTYVLPQLAPGLWQVDMTAEGEEEVHTRWFCIQPGHTELLPLAGDETIDCTREYRAQADDSVILTLRCEASADEFLDISGIFQGDFARTYSGELQIQNPDSTTETARVEAHRVGDCTPGMAPCDRAVAGECSDPND